MLQVLNSCHIRLRKFEWTKPNSIQKKDLLDLGDKVSHYGTVLADALMFDDSCLMKQTTNISVFTAMYGVKPSFVLKNRASTKLMDILDWRGAMKDFHDISQKNTTYELSAFHKSLKTLLDDHLCAIQNDADFFETDPQGQHFYHLLRKEYETALEKHQAHLARKRG
jgi:hypothetical protein